MLGEAILATLRPEYNLAVQIGIWKCDQQYSDYSQKKKKKKQAVTKSKRPWF